MRFLHIIYLTTSMVFTCNGMKQQMPPLALALQQWDSACYAIHNKDTNNNIAIVTDTLYSRYKKLAEKNCYGTVIFPIKELNTLFLQGQELKTLYFLPFPLSSIKCNFSYLITLDVTGNKLTDLPLDMLCNKLPNLEELKAGHNEITYMSLGWKKTNSKLRLLDLQYNKLRMLDLERLMAYFPHLKTIITSDNLITKLIMLSNRNIGTATDHLSHEWHHIDLSNNKLSPENIQLITKQYITDLKDQLALNRKRSGIKVGIATMGLGIILNLFIDPSSPVIGAASVPVGYIIRTSVIKCCEQWDNEKIKELAMFKHIQLENDKGKSKDTIK